MTNEEMIELFDPEPDDEEYLNFKAIPKENRLHSNSQLCGLLKLASLMDEPEKLNLHGDFECSDGGTIVLGVAADDDDDFDPFYGMSITEEDILYLRRCGISYDYSRQCLSMTTSLW